jgi:aldehyde dehydrogenase (NAD+)
MTRAERASALNRIAAVIRKHQNELAALETLCNGKTFKESLYDDLPESASVFEYYAGWIDKIYGETCPVEQGFVNFTLREPVGPCALIVPWNFPLLLACWKIAPALAMGNTVVVKPSPMTSLTMIRLAEIIHAEGILPRGVFNVVTGGRETGEALTRHKSIAKVSFTGGTDTGRSILKGSAESNLKAVTLELGGKSPNIIFEDAKNLEAVIDRSFQAMFSHKGEKCSEPTRLLVHRSLHDRVVKALVEKAEKVRCGDPFADTTEQGPQCFEDHMKKILSYIESGLKEGARCVAGGKRDDSAECKKGFFVRPTIFTNVTPAMKIFQEEIFGPVLAVSVFDTEEQAIELANATRYGLAAGLYTADADRAMRVARKLEAGMVFVNRYGCYDFASPFGGYKESGWGKEMAIHSLEAYTRRKSIWFTVAKN